MEPTDVDLIELIVRLPRATAETLIRSAASSSGDSAQRRVALAKLILSSRRKRAKTFKRIRLGEPSWDMILDLYVNDQEGNRVDVSGLCLASGVAPSTALRYVELLIEAELISKVDDALDGRRSFVVISEALRAKVSNWLAQAEAGLGIAGWIASPDPMSDQGGDADRAQTR